MKTKLATWPFTVSAIACGVFLVLTAMGMVFYPGGTLVDKTTRGYSFLMNAFSDMGMTVTLGGHRNRLSFFLFTAGLASAGVGLALFFTAFSRIFSHSKGSRVLAITGAFLGILAGVGFLGVASTPADLMLMAHLWFVNWAFRFFTLATLCFTVCIMRSPNYPKSDGWLLAGFTLLLISYILLLNYGPGMDTPRGLMIMVVGQKIIAYASILCVLILALHARKWILAR